MGEITRKTAFPPPDLKFGGGYDTVFLLFCGVKITYFIYFLIYSYACWFAAAAADAAGTLLQPQAADAAAAAAAPPAVATAAHTESSTQR